MLLSLCPGLPNLLHGLLNLRIGRPFVKLFHPRNLVKRTSERAIEVRAIVLDSDQNYFPARPLASGTCSGKMAVMSTKGSIVLSFTYFALLMARMGYGQIALYNTSTTVTPPAGNSPSKNVKAVSSYLIYTCVNGAWVRGKGYAALVNDTNKVIGNYTTVIDNQGELGTWALINDIGDATESGHKASFVTARPVASSSVGTYSASLPSELLEATSHVYAGAASLVSYIQIYNIVGGLPPPADTCLNRTYTSKTVPFTADFCLWTQDSVPASVSDDLVAPGRVVEGFFGKGHISYTYNGSAWIDSGKNGTLYTIPGTPAVGQFSVKSGSQCWQIYDPNGFVICGKLSSSEVDVSADSCPWSLSNITSSTGSTMPMGAFSHVQMTSTRGGLPPTSSFQPFLGAVQKVPFSAIFWFYVST